jgi:hypothetical protein
MLMPSETSSSISDLSARLAKKQLRSADRFSELLRRIASRQLDTTVVGQEAVRFAKESAGDYARSLLGLGLGYRLALLDLSRQYGDRLLERLLHIAESAEAAVERRRAEITLTGPVDSEASAPFAIANDQPHPETISFIVSEFTDTAGQGPFRPPLRLEPSQLTLAPGEEGLVTLRLPLLSELFVPGRLYRAKVLVRGHELELALTALAYRPTPAAAEQARPAQPKRTTRRAPTTRPARSSRPTRPGNQAGNQDGSREDDHAG